MSEPRHMTPNEVTELQRLYDHAAELTNNIILPKIAEIWKNVDWRYSQDRASAALYSSFTSIEGDNVLCEGDEYTGFGGSEHYCITFPVYYLYNSAFDRIEETIRDQKLAEIKEKQRIADEDKARKIEEQERELLKALTEKYGLTNNQS
jgi:hypothetical protein